MCLLQFLLYIMQLKTSTVHKGAAKQVSYAKHQSDSFESTGVNSGDPLVNASLRELDTVICIELLIKINYTRLHLSEVHVPHIGTKRSAGGSCTEKFNVNSDFNFLIETGVFFPLY